MSLHARMLALGAAASLLGAQCAPALATQTVRAPLAAKNHWGSPTPTLTTLHAFTGTPDGARPNQLLFDRGRLYGTTAQGGASGDGTIFTLGLGGESILHSFSGTDGQLPYAGLVRAGNTLYGTTVLGGTGCTGGCGTVFALTPAGFTTAYAFAGGTDGKLPEANLTVTRNALYGTTVLGGGTGCGGGGCGTVFKLGFGSEQVLYAFAGGTDGQIPVAPLLDVQGQLYGTTFGGGASGDGIVFKIDPTTGHETILHTFAGTDGAQPLAGLTYFCGALYGTTYGGGTSKDGTVFRIDPATGNETVVHAFSGTDGAQPDGALVEMHGDLYGTAFSGGSQGFGSIFRIDGRTGAFTTLYNFTDGPDGANPGATLIAVGGVLFGTTHKGGSSAGGGTVFSFVP